MTNGPEMVEGFAIVPNVFSATECDELGRAVADSLPRRGGNSSNLRNLLRDVWPVATLARSSRLFDLVTSCLGQRAFPVRALWFDKTPEANWAVPWHQDLAIAVKERVDVPGFGGWSVKAGVHHVHAPVTVLEQMLVARLHLDCCGADNGALQILSGSHQEGKLDGEAIESWKTRVSPIVYKIERGGVLLMKPLLLHASQPAVTPGHRRVLHIEYATCALPGGLEWFDWNVL